MSESSESKLVESLVWSHKAFSLAQFVETYELPQVIRVVVGFFGNNERTTLGKGQILTLHSLRKTSKVLCKVPNRRSVLVPSSCPLKVEVLPEAKDCPYATITANLLSGLSHHVKYVRVLTGNYDKKKCPGKSLGKDDVLQILNIDCGKRRINCKNVATDQKVSVSFKSTVSFAPLLDHKEYTLAEVKWLFGLPAKVRFLDKKGERKLRAEDRSVTSLGEVTVLEDIEETVVVSTTVSGTWKNKVCLQIPKDLDIEVVVAEGFLSGDQTYQCIVKTLDKVLNRTRLKDFENLDVYEHIDAAEKSIQDVFVDFSVEMASDEIKQRVTVHSSGELTDDKRPQLGSSQASALSVVSPKSDPKQIARCNVLKRSPKMIDKFKALSKRPVGLKSLSSTLQSDKSDSGSSEHVETTQPELDYVDVIENSNYTDLNTEYVSSNNDVYQTLDWGKEEVAKASIAQPDVLLGSNVSTRNSTVREDDYDEPDSGTAESLTKRSRPLPELPQGSTKAARISTVRGGDYDEPDSGTTTSLTKPSISQLEVSQRSTISTRKSTATADDYDEPDSGWAERPTRPSITQPEASKSTLSEKEEIYQSIARIPQDLSSLSIEDVGSLLVNLGMATYVQLFEDEMVDGDMLASMDQESLESLNVSPYHVKKLLKFINGWRPNVTSVLI